MPDAPDRRPMPYFNSASKPNSKPSPRRVGHRGGRLAFVVSGLLLPIAAAFAAPPADSPTDTAPGDASSAFIWWEAEVPTTSTFPGRSAFSVDTFTEPHWIELLSGGDWLTASGPTPAPPAAPPSATYRLEVPAAGRYHLWARRYWRHGPVHWRFEDQPWQTMARDAALTDRQRFGTHYELSWTALGEVQLPAGGTTFEIQLATQPGEDQVAAYDCFVLSRDAFFPRGKFPPDADLRQSVAPEPGWFVFDPPVDGFAPDAELDLRTLNEAAAGQHGPLRRSADGESILLGDGRPVRFWSVNLGWYEAGQPDDHLEHLARRLAKLGVNMVRFHSPLWDETGGLAVSPRRLDRLHRLAAALKGQGIYLNLSWYFPLWIKDAGQMGLAGYDGRPAGERRPFAVTFFSPRAREFYVGHLRTLLTTVNPYTGLSLARDPALGVVELCNEDSLFFWTTNRRTVSPTQWSVLESRFADHLAARYGSLRAALEQWPGAAHERDDAAAHVAGVWDIWHLTGEAYDQQSEGQRRRAAEQAAFFAALQRDFYAGAVDLLRSELGYAGLIAAGNWHTADARRLDALERWTYLPADLNDQHGYFNPARHDGPASSYSVRVGDVFADRSALKHPGAVPLRVVQTAGRAQMISEMGWTHPNRYRADQALLTAAVAANQGLDIVTIFTWTSARGLDTSVGKFPASTPLVAQSFPAAALLFRRGDVPAAPVAVRRVVPTRADAVPLSPEVGDGAALEAGDTLDAFRRGDLPAVERRPPAEDRLDLAAYAGPVVRRFDDAAQPYVAPRLADALDPRGRRIDALPADAGATPAYRWDYRRGLLRVDTPRVQAVAGYLQEAGPQTLGDLTWQTDNDYAQLTAVSLDDLPLATSRRILLQAATHERFTGFATQPVRDDKGSARGITGLGGPPIQLQSVHAIATLAPRPDAPSVRRVIALDGNGQPTDTPVSHTGDGITTPLIITLPPQHLYTLIQR